MLLLGTAASFAWLAAEATDARDAALGAAASARRDHTEATRALREIRAALSDESAEPAVPVRPGASMDAMLTATVTALHQMALARQVDLARISVAGLTGTQQSYVASSALARVLPHTGDQVQAARLKLSGTYKDYAEFKTFIDNVAWLAAIQSYSVKADKFDLDIEIYCGAGHAG